MSTALQAAFRLRSRSSHWHGGGCQQKQKKSIDQRAPQIGYEGIKSLWSLAMKSYLVTGGLLSLVESYNNKHLLVFLATNIIFIGQMEKDIGRGVSRVQYLSTATNKYDIRLEVDQ